MVCSSYRAKPLRITFFFFYFILCLLSWIDVRTEQNPYHVTILLHSCFTSVHSIQSQSVCEFRWLLFFFFFRFLLVLFCSILFILLGSTRSFKKFEKRLKMCSAHTIGYDCCWRPNHHIIGWSSFSPYFSFFAFSLFWFLLIIIGAFFCLQLKWESTLLHGFVLHCFHSILLLLLLLALFLNS